MSVSAEFLKLHEDFVVSYVEKHGAIFRELDYTSNKLWYFRRLSQKLVFSRLVQF